ncbi:TonB-dependent receptor plug domain-containing protein [Kordiimonas laminariae]|uniref:TonB-dependent receptor plug domain-containing protein n=1 Tax=Kordiimonas laminariae TaxID=2917717 RepID=UPI001FF6A277|nr:TonB-dependent receptor [Kordiimonas laminariae]MCK0070617.1 TonB-dependent receptor [Kordiimonas laminariae]
MPFPQTIKFNQNTKIVRPHSLAVLSVLLPAFITLDAQADATEFYDLKEISVTAVRSKDRVLQPALDLDQAYFEQTVPTDFTDVFRGVLGVGIRTNSRGEAVLRLRGSEERQSQVFIDGAPISVPWDGRADLSLFPASLIRSARVIKSAAPIEYGANAVLGVVDISTLVDSDEFRLNARTEYGTHDTFTLEGDVYIPIGNWALQFGANHFERDAISVADADVIPFDPLEGEGRTNTDLESTSLFAAVSLDEEWGTVRASVFDINSEKGIAAAAHIDPAVGNPRFWRYPNWHMTQMNLAADINLNDTTSLRVNTWRQDFEQTILSFTDANYNELEDRQDDEDNTWGGRVVLSHEQPLITTRLVASLQQSTHEQTEDDVLGGVNGELERFRQRLFSVGGEVDVPLSENVKTSFALAYDRAATPLTGGRPDQPAIGKWAASGALEWQASPDLTITATVGQRLRFPTMRELYGTALGRFLLNPDLRPETALLADITVDWAPADLPITLTVTPWVSRIDDTLSRRNVTVDGSVLRQRFNLEGSRGIGLEAAFTWAVSDGLSFEANMLLQDLEANRDEEGNRPVLFQRPNSQILLAANYRFEGGANIRAEMNHTGRAFDEDEDDSVVALNRSNEFNVQFYVPLKETSFGSLQFYGALNNITDTVVLPQLGLPAPGRTIKFGIRLNGG